MDSWILSPSEVLLKAVYCQFACMDLSHGYWILLYFQNLNHFKNICITLPSVGHNHMNFDLTLTFFWHHWCFHLELVAVYSHLPNVCVGVGVNCCLPSDLYFLELVAVYSLLPFNFLHKFFDLVCTFIFQILVFF